MSGYGIYKHIVPTGLKIPWINAIYKHCVPTGLKSIPNSQIIPKLTPLVTILEFHKLLIVVGTLRVPSLLKKGVTILTHPSIILDLTNNLRGLIITLISLSSR